MAPTENQPLQSVHTTSLPVFLTHGALTILVSTYQAGKLFLVRADEGVANTHFRNFDVPMGLAFDKGRLAIGCRTKVWEFRNTPAVAPKLEPANKHDACFIPRSSHHTGHIAGHEMAWSGSDLWIVNTRFSCLCTLNVDYSFVPRWRPDFITALMPEDRCHLNGLALVDGEPRYVTALGATDNAAGWRENKASGGILLEVPSSKIIASGLSMPHSPRWHDGKLWILESGKGTLAIVDRSTGQLEVVATLPGFTRGLDFVGPYALIGLSQVRESALFSGLPITDRLPVEERCCGVWIVDTRNGQTVAFLKFVSGVQEVFAVIGLLGMKFPDLLNEDESDHLANTFILPDDALADVPIRS